jgi:hypothetical protein
MQADPSPRITRPVTRLFNETWRRRSEPSRSEMTERQPTLRFETRKAAIVMSAVGVLNRKGVRGMTLSDVAASINLVPTGVIYYFKNKEELAQACFLKGIRRCSSEPTSISSAESPAAKLR